jgi:hypothetical protein
MEQEPSKTRHARSERSCEAYMCGQWSVDGVTDMSDEAYIMSTS